MLTITIGEVSTLNHELWNHTMESRAFITVPILSSGKSTEVLRSLRSCLSVQADDNSAQGLITVGYIKEHLKLY